MKRHWQNLFKLGFLITLPLGLACGQLMKSTPSNSHLEKVHSAYLAKDFSRMVGEIKNTFETANPDPLVQSNLLALLRKAYDLQGTSGLPVDWQLPEEILRMRVGVRRGGSEIPEYQLKIYGQIKEPGVIKQLKVRRFPNQVLADKMAGIGYWEEIPEDDGKTIHFDLNSNNSRQPIPGGLYLLDLELNNGKTVAGWFLLEDDSNATASPNVLVPAVGETFHTGTPTFRWDDFRSPQYRPTESRVVWMAINLANPPDDKYDPKWEFYSESPSLTNITVGLPPNGPSGPGLANGRYKFTIKYMERRRFGDLLISREAATSRFFAIEKETP